MPGRIRKPCVLRILPGMDLNQDPYPSNQPRNRKNVHSHFMKGFPMKRIRTVLPISIFLASLLALTSVFADAAASVSTAEPADTSVIRLGIIGTDTSHVPAFVKLFNAPNAEGDYQKLEITAAVKGGMPDNESSWSRKDQYPQDIVPFGVKIYATIEEMLPHVDGVLIESVDGRPHLEFARPVIAAGKPLFIDKPMAGNLWETLEIFRLAEEKNVPLFSASSLRYSASIQEVRNASPYGETHGIAAWSPCHLNECHPDFYWYGIHGVETLFTMMGGAGCVSVSRTSTPNYDLAVGVWNDGRIGTFRGIRAGSAPYGGMVFGSKGVNIAGKYDGYKPLCDQICTFFLTGKSPIDPQETLEIMAFMSAADASKAQNGAHVTLESVIESAKALKVRTFSVKLAADGKLQLDGNDISLTDLNAKLRLPDTRSYYRVIFENLGTDDSARDAVLQNLGDAVLVRYIYP